MEARSDSLLDRQFIRSNKSRKLPTSHSKIWVPMQSSSLPAIMGVSWWTCSYRTPSRPCHTRLIEATRARTQRYRPHPSDEMAHRRQQVWAARPTTSANRNPSRRVSVSAPKKASSCTITHRRAVTKRAWPVRLEATRRAAVSRTCTFSSRPLRETSLRSSAT